jgi:hypothetical protein
MGLSTPWTPAPESGCGRSRAISRASAGANGSPAVYVQDGREYVVMPVGGNDFGMAGTRAKMTSVGARSLSWAKRNPVFGASAAGLAG